MKTFVTRLRTGASGKRLGVAALGFFLAKGLLWMALGVSGYSIWAH